MNYVLIGEICAFRVGFDMYAAYLVGQLAYVLAMRAFNMSIDNETAMYRTIRTVVWEGGVPTDDTHSARFNS